MRSNLILAAIAAALAFFTVHTWKTQRVEFTNYDDIPRLFEGFTPANVAAIVVSAPERDDQGELVTGEDGKIKREALQMLSRDGKWFLQNTEIAGALVREDRVRENVLDRLQRIRRDEKALIKESAPREELETYGLTEEESIVVQCYDAGGNPLAELVLGKPAHEGAREEGRVPGFFVRRRDSADVVLFEEDYWLITTNREHWVDRNLQRFDPSQAVEVTITNPQGKLVVYKDDPADPDWKVREGPEGVGALRSAEITGFVGTFRYTNIQFHVKRLPPAGPQRDQVLAEYGLADAKYSASIKLADGETYGTWIGNQAPGKNEYYFRASNSDFVTTVGDWILSPYERNPADYFDPPADAVRKPDEPPDEEQRKEDGPAGKGEGQTESGDGPETEKTEKTETQKKGGRKQDGQL